MKLVGVILEMSIKKCPSCNSVMYKRASKIQGLIYRCGICGLHLRRMKPINEYEINLLQEIAERDSLLSAQEYSGKT